MLGTVCHNGRCGSKLGKPMYRTVAFKFTSPDEWTFDQNNSPTAPGARDLAEAIVANLRPHVTTVSEIEQHEFYGWRFQATLDHSTFCNVLNPVEECYLTVSMNWYELKWLLLKRP